MRLSLNCESVRQVLWARPYEPVGSWARGPVAPWPRGIDSSQLTK